MKLLGEARIKGFVHNHPVDLPGNRLYYIDFANAIIMLGFEVDSKTYHSAKSQKERDAFRQNALEEAGWTIIRFSSTDILKKPDLVKKAIRAAVGKAAQDALSESFPLG